MKYREQDEGEGEVFKIWSKSWLNDHRAALDSGSTAD